MNAIATSITIDKSPHVVFEFCLDPKNTHLWVESVLEEKTNEWPVKLGTVYRNRRKDGNWSEYEIVSLEQDRQFVMRSADGMLVKYVFTPIPPTATKLDYSLTFDSGIPNPSLDTKFLDKLLNELKAVIERSS